MAREAELKDVRGDLMDVRTHTLAELLFDNADDRIRAFYEFWDRSRGAKHYPAQKDLRLSAVPKLLPEIFIIDHLPEGDFRYRFMGTAIDRLVGGSFTGRRFSESRSGRVLSEITEFFGTVVRFHVYGVMHTRLRSETTSWDIFTRTGLPVADDGETPNKVVGMIFTNSKGSRIEENYSAHWTATDEQGLVVKSYGALPD